MKTKRSRRTKQLASSLLVVMAICALLVVGIAAYLSLIQQQSMLSTRSQSWNMAIAIAEAGVEDGLEALNSSGGNVTGNGWTANGNVYTRTQTLADGNSYTVQINLSNSSNPTVSAQATVTVPILARNAGPVFFAAAGVPQTTTTTVTRAVRVRCSKSNLFTCAFVCKHSIDLKGNGVFTDSYDSSDPAKSTNCRYGSSNYSGDHGDIASNGGIADSIGVQNANIYGIVHTGPNQPVSIGSQGGVGPHGSQVGNVATAVAKGYIVQDANFTYPDTTLRSISGLLQPPSGTVVTPTYSFSTNAVTSANYPSPTPAGGVATNQSYTTVSSIPSPLPSSLITNTTYNTVSSLPSPVPSATTTNLTTTTTTTSDYPGAGTYVGGVTTNYNGSSKKIKDYTYNLITGTTYTYPAFTYTYPCPTYTYDTSQTTVIYTTNYYDNVIYANTTNYAYSLSGSTLIAGPNACLILPNGLSGSENFTIAQGAGVVIYSGGTSVTVSGNQVLNPNGYPGSFIVLCAPTVTSFTLNGNGEFTGVLVAPNADVAMNGGGNSNQDFCGSLMVNSVRMNGHFSFHWDESLAKMRGNGRFLINSWDEIPPFL